MKFKFVCRVCFKHYELDEMKPSCPFCGSVAEENYWIDSPLVTNFLRIMGRIDSEEERFNVIDEVLKMDRDINVKLSPLGSTMGGWICARDRHVIQQILINYSEKNPVVLEIGVYTGGSANAILASRPDCIYIGIDNWSEASLDDFLKNTDPFKDRVEIISGDSQIIGKNWTRPLDILLVDGGHSYDVALSDIKNFVPWAKVGGAIMVDDYVGIREVKRAVDECLVNNPDFEVLSYPNSPYGIAEKLITFRRIH